MAPPDIYDTQAESRTVQVDFTLAVGQGRLNASLPVTAGDITLTQLLPVLQSLTSHIVDSATAIASAEGYQVSCRAGCGACCRQLVPLSIFEAEALSEWIQSLPLEQQLELKGRFDAALHGLHDAGLLTRLNPELWNKDTVQPEGIAIDYLAAKVPCPFLRNESCSIHPIRPLICREYLVASPPEFCALPTKDSVTLIQIPIHPSGVLYKLGAQIEQGGNGWIPLVFLFAWMKGEAHPGELVKGPGPELLYEFVKRLT